MMAGFFIVFIILAELASATTNDQPANSTTADSTAVAGPNPEPVSAPAEVSVEPTSTPAKTPRSLSYGANEIIKMYKGGVKTDVLNSYIETAALSYQLSSKEILYLSQIGMPSELVTAMIQHDHHTAVAARQQTTETTSELAQPATAPVVYSQPVVVVQQPKVKYVSAPVCSTPVCSTVSQPSPNVTVIGSRYGSTFYNGCYYGPFSCYSPARAYFNSQFGPQYGYDFGGYRNRFAYNGYGYGGFGYGYGGDGFGRHHGRF
jgi:hypothetical protein